MESIKTEAKQLATDARAHQQILISADLLDKCLFNVLRATAVVRTIDASI